MFLATLLLSLLAVLSSGFVLLRLLESWRVGPEPASHSVSLLGQRISYPAANGAAIVVTVLGALGLLMALAALIRVGRELCADWHVRRTLAGTAPLDGHDAWLVRDERPQAFCAGLARPRVYVSTGAVALLDSAALAAVLAHERHHAERRDPLRLACGRVLAAALFFLPHHRRLASRQSALAEISADEAAVSADGGDRSALASAMLGFSEASDDDAVGVDPERIDNLLEQRARWAFPFAVCLASAAFMALLVVVCVLAARSAAGSATFAPPFLSSQPCVAVLAMIPAGALLAAYLLRSDARPARAETAVPQR